MMKKIKVAFKNFRITTGQEDDFLSLAVLLVLLAVIFVSTQQVFSYNKVPEIRQMLIRAEIENHNLP